MKPSLRQRFASYAGVGAIGTAAHYVVLLILVEALWVDAVVATTLGAAGGTLVNYGLNYKYTFRSQAGHRPAMPKFAATAFIGLLLNTLIVHMAIAGGAMYLMAQVAATGVVLLFGFLVNQFWTFRESIHGKR